MLSVCNFVKIYRWCKCLIINDAFKEETQKRGIPIYDAYNIQKRLYHEVEQEMLVGEEAVDNRLMELLEEKGKKLYIKKEERLSPYPIITNV